MDKHSHLTASQSYWVIRNKFLIRIFFSAHVRRSLVGKSLIDEKLSEEKFGDEKLREKTFVEEKLNR